MESTEKWLPVPGWEGLYEVSDHGNMRAPEKLDSLGRRRKAQSLRLSSDDSGHLGLQLSRPDGTRQYSGVHRLVLLAFVGPCPEGMEGCHWDDDPANNRLTNLRWGTPSENAYDKVRNGRHQHANKTHCPRGHEYIPENVVPAQFKDGKRACLACSREQASAKNQCRAFDESLADGRYASILADVAQGIDPRKQRPDCPHGHPLEDVNLVPSTLKLGYRGCLACSRERSSAKHHKRPFDPALADERYRQIVSQRIA